MNTAMTFKFNLYLKIVSNRPSSILNSNFRFQLLATLTGKLCLSLFLTLQQLYVNIKFFIILVSTLTLAHGISLGWLSPTLSSLQTEMSPLNFTVNIDEASWIGSLLGLGSMCGNIAIGVLQNKIGRKKSIFLLALSHTVNNYNPKIKKNGKVFNLN